MSHDANNKRPIIIVKKHAAHDDEHGGHWKIAYADFVTAMMAFFLVMWLINAVSEKQRRGIAQYFSAVSVMDLNTGNGMLNGNRSVLNGADSQLSPMQMSRSDDSNKDDDESEPSHDSKVDTDQRGNLDKQNTDRSEAQRLQAMRSELDHLTQDGALKNLAQNISVEITPEGLRVQIFDRDGAPMFEPGSADPNHRLSVILASLAPVLAAVPNKMVITGHTDNQAFDKGGYGNWELSSDRANSIRRFMEAHGIDNARMFKVEGRSSTDPLLPEAPGDARNRRIALTLLRNSAATKMQSANSAGAAGKAP